MMIRIDSLADPRVAPYCNLKDRELDRAGKLFIAEGEHLVHRLLASDFPVESVFVAEKHAERFEQIVPVEVPLYVTSTETMNEILGMKFHSGVIACGKRKPWKPLDEILAKTIRDSQRGQSPIALHRGRQLLKSCNAPSRPASSRSMKEKMSATVFINACGIKLYGGTC